MPQHQYELAGLTVLHMTQPVEGGVARVVMDLVRAQVGAGARVVVASPSEPPGRPDRPGPAGTPGAPGAPGPLAAAVTAAGAEPVRWPARRSPGPALAREVAAAGRVLRAARPDLLHLHSAKAGLAGRLAARGALPTVFQPHAWSFEAVTGPAAGAALRWERYAAARWTDLVLCVSEAERATGRRQGVRADWAVVPNGVDTARFAPAADRAAVRAALPALCGLAPGAPLVVCVGRLCPQKGQDVLLRAWPDVAARLPGARLALVGDGPDRDRLFRDAPPGVLLAGASADPGPWYQAADVVVQPSRWEGMALAPLEAMACGRPVVLTDVAGARESLPPADTAGCVVPVADPPALAAALLRLLTDPRLRTAAGARALGRVRDRHDVRRAAAEVAALYGALLALPRPYAVERVPR
ncbi:glycosyltransferase family 4 protein [Actinacidiphila sp. ITFR-21]|uniref:glycosyltransferase family 4 protein n=1 Tax=Actinacidiphila sp. ITFR-21 TaxID=3075199 RepID=UPI00288A99DF|nr:glycosyltransferase family 4 protein [Streptomyces sp. ITFR-21]WNI16484.1 glycosyltransferase family 4 protein [Streptomyces sp. ITFR-21]